MKRRTARQAAAAIAAAMIGATNAQTINVLEHARTEWPGFLGASFDNGGPNTIAEIDSDSESTLRYRIVEGTTKGDEEWKTLNESALADKRSDAIALCAQRKTPAWQICRMVPGWQSGQREGTRQRSCDVAVHNNTGGNPGPITVLRHELVGHCATQQVLSKGQYRNMITTIAEHVPYTTLLNTWLVIHQGAKQIKIGQRYDRMIASKRELWLTEKRKNGDRHINTRWWTKAINDGEFDAEVLAKLVEEAAAMHTTIRSGNPRKIGEILRKPHDESSTSQWLHHLSADLEAVYRAKLGYNEFNERHQTILGKPDEGTRVSGERLWPNPTPE